MFILAASACATDRDKPDRYRQAANSWRGASIVEMVAAWGPPNAGYYPAYGDREGIAGWKAEYTRAGRSHYECITFAYFAASQLITRIEVRRARHCDRRFSKQYASMTYDDGDR